MQSYIVRVYRKGKGLSRDLVGMVQEVGGREARPFKNRQALLDILNAPEEAPGPVKRDRKPRKGPDLRPPRKPGGRRGS